ncbi:sigma-70 family RNA polymerase sigma factor [Vibrio marisflavi]|uniref:ECF RNA polymerase sigma factor RpoE n=1 Tax=Vibrio marisflavi CECT 7928 TaxID=634439 RepID=A0ABN8DYJ4_9VIBR|nr:sigma-70 family RNA polymerase sigma factor [Vibrio marisflavi]CAH0536694.1 ECF RNA polymerase sigma factor RpoE [Vibrio marisflavi CECT 7928]
MEQIQHSSASISGERPISQSKYIQAHPELSRWLSLVAIQQDKEAFSILFKFFAPRIQQFGLKQFRNESQANELVQDTMTNVWRKAHLYDAKKGAATTWIYTVMRNAAFDLSRKAKSKPEQNIGDDIWPLDQVLSSSNEASMLSDDYLMSKHLHRVVESLPEAQKVVVQGVYFQELTQEQLSVQLGVPIGTIKSRLRLALEKIRSQMKEQDND